LRLSIRILAITDLVADYDDLLWIESLRQFHPPQQICEARVRAKRIEQRFNFEIDDPTGARYTSPIPPSPIFERIS